MNFLFIFDLITLNILEFPHFIDGNGTFAVDPFALDVVLVSHQHYFSYTTYIVVCNEPKASWFVCPLVLQNHAVFQISELSEVISKLHQC